MSHLIRIYAVCKFSKFRLWYLNSFKILKATKMNIAEFANGVEPDDQFHQLDL